jgi:hypothetical protein
MERKSKGSRSLEAYCKGGQGPLRAVAPPKKKKYYFQLHIRHLSTKITFNFSVQNSCQIVKIKILFSLNFNITLQNSSYLVPQEVIAYLLQFLTQVINVSNPRPTLTKCRSGKLWFSNFWKNSLIVQSHDPTFWHSVPAVNLTCFMNNLAAVFKEQDLWQTLPLHSCPFSVTEIFLNNLSRSEAMCKVL